MLEARFVDFNMDALCLFQNVGAEEIVSVVSAFSTIFLSVNSQALMLTRKLTFDVITYIFNFSSRLGEVGVLLHRFTFTFPIPLNAVFS